MARDPADRPETARQFSQALRRWLASSEAESVRRKQLSPRTWALLGGASLLAALATAWLQNHWAHGEETPASLSPSTIPAPSPAVANTESGVSNPAPTAAPVRASLASDTLLAAATTTSAVPPQDSASTAQPKAPVAAASGTAPAPRKPAAPPAAVKRSPETTAKVVDKPAPPPATGTLRLAVSPWGQVEIDGRAVGTTPPLTHIQLPVGTHTVTIRNGDLPAFTTSVTVHEENGAKVQHRFSQ